MLRKKLNKCPEHKCERWMKSGSKFFFHFVDISESKAFMGKTFGDLFLSLQK